MDKVNLLAYHPNAKNVMATASHDLGKPTLRVWNTASSSLTPELTLAGTHDDTILAMAWRPDGKAIATFSKDKQLRVVDARTGELLGKTKAHDGIRPSRLAWLDDDRYLASVGFGIGSMREVLVFDTLALSSSSKPLAKQSIDVSPSIMNAYYDRDCRILYVAGKVRGTATYGLNLTILCIG
jgi:coronin-7